MSHYRSFIAVNRSSLPKTLHEQKSYVFSLFLTYGINSIYDPARSQKFAMGGAVLGSGGGAPSARKFCIFLQK